MATSLERLIDDFLAQERIAVAGVSRDPKQPANLIYRKLRGAGHEVIALNPKAQRLEEAPCYPNLRALPVEVQGVVIATPPSAAVELVQECADLGIKRVWMHRSFGRGSVSDDAVELCSEQGIEVIAGGCPMMYCKPVDLGHRCMRWLLKVSGGLPKAG